LNQERFRSDSGKNTLQALPADKEQNMAHGLRISMLVGWIVVAGATTAMAQWSSVTYDPATGEQYPLYQVTSRGMFGVQEYGVPIKPDNKNSRFPHHGIRFGPSGAILGVDRSAANSMFKPSLLPQAGFEARNYYPEPGRTTLTPRPRPPRQPQNMQFAQGSPVPESELVGGQRLRPEQFQRDGRIPGRTPTPRQPTPPQRPSEEIWFRGAPSESSRTTAEPNTPSADPFYGGAGMMGAARQPGGGTLRAPTPGAAQMTSSDRARGNPPQTFYFQPQQQDRTGRIEEQLELSLLQSPSVNLQSPVRVTLQNGVATVRGIVPTAEHRMQAGRLLLSNPAVNQVNNLMVPLSERDTLPEPIELNPVTPDPGEMPTPENPASSGSSGPGGAASSETGQ
jgi:hypothetical protein